MKAFSRQILVLLLVLVTVLTLVGIAVPASAASVTYYQTAKADVPIWSKASSSSTKLRVIAAQGTVLQVTGSTVNSSNNRWYQLSDGSWVFSGNVTKHSHSYDGGICKGIGCGYEYPLSIYTYNATVIVSASDGAKIWSRPYSNRSTQLWVASQGTALTINAQTSNAAGNTWYRLTDGSWVYSGNVTVRYTVSYNANGGSGAPSAQYLLAGNTLTLSSTKPTRSGYIFQGWGLTASTSVVSYKAGSLYSGGSATLHAVWKACSHKSYTGGTCDTCGYEYPLSVSSHSATYRVTNSNGAKIWNRPYSKKSTQLSLASSGTDLSVVGKVTNAEGNVWYKLSDGSWVFSGNVTRVYTVQYNVNGGSGTLTSQTFLSGKTLKLTTVKPTRAGYVFQGWATSADATSVNYKAGGSYSAKKSVTLYAVWKTCSHKSYTLGLCNTCGKEYPLSITTLDNYKYVVTNDEGAAYYSRPYSHSTTKLGTKAYETVLTVVGKTVNAQGNTWMKLSDGTWVYSGNITKRHTVKYNANGGTGAPDSQTFLSGKTLTLSSAKPTRVGYVFQGWATSANATKVKYKAGDTYSTKKSVTLYAVWKTCSHKNYSGGYCTTCAYEYPLTVKSHAATYVVTKSGGAKLWTRPYSTQSSSPEKAAKGTVLSVTGKTVNEDGNTWYQLNSGNWIYSGNVTRQYTVKYNANGGSGAPDSQAFLSGKTLKLTTAKPTRDGYTFQGWATSAKATKATYSAGSSYSSKKNITLYAVWSKCSSHKYSYGICKNCGHEQTLDIQDITNSVYHITDTDGVTVYQRPYTRKADKVKTLSKGSVVLVTHKTTKSNGSVWYKLSDGSWIHEDDVGSKKATYSKISSIKPKYFSALDGGTIGVRSFDGVWYYSFSTKSTTVYVKATAFTGTPNTNQLDTLNQTMSNAIGAYGYGSGTILHAFSSSKQSSWGLSLFSQTYTVRTWSLNKLTAGAGILTGDTIQTDCTLNGSVNFVYHTMVPYDKLTITAGSSRSMHAPATAAEYLACLERKSASTSVCPNFTVSVTETAANASGNTGYFTAYNIHGYGYTCNDLTLTDYISLFTSSKKIFSASKELVKATAFPANALKTLAKETWGVLEMIGESANSSEYKTKHPKILNLYNASTGEVMEFYKITVTSPIQLKYDNDYLVTTYSVFEYNKKLQTFDVSLNLTDQLPGSVTGSLG